MNILKIKAIILTAFGIGMIEITILNFVNKDWTAPYFAGLLLIDTVLMFLTFNYIDKTK